MSEFSYHLLYTLFFTNLCVYLTTCIYVHMYTNVVFGDEGWLARPSDYYNKADMYNEYNDMTRAAAAGIQHAQLYTLY